MQSLTDAEVAVLLRLDFKRFRAWRRQGIIPEPMIRRPEERWTEEQLRPLLGLRPAQDKAGAEADAMAALENA